MDDLSQHSIYFFLILIIIIIFIKSYLFFSVSSKKLLHNGLFKILGEALCSVGV